MKIIKKIILLITISLIIIIGIIWLNTEVPIFNCVETYYSKKINDTENTKIVHSALPIQHYVQITETKVPTTTRFDKFITDLVENKQLILFISISIAVINIIILIKTLKLKTNTEKEKNNYSNYSSYEYLVIGGKSDQSFTKIMQEYNKK